MLCTFLLRPIILNISIHNHQDQRCQTHQLYMYYDNKKHLPFLGKWTVPRIKADYFKMFIVLLCSMS